MACGSAITEVSRDRSSDTVRSVLVFSTVRVKGQVMRSNLSVMKVTGTCMSFLAEYRLYVAHRPQYRDLTTARILTENQCQGGFQIQP